jgi:hypothetical protein
VSRRVCALTSTSRASAPSSATMRCSCRADRRPRRPSYRAGSPRRAAGCRARSVSQRRSRRRASVGSGTVRGRSRLPARTCTAPVRSAVGTSSTSSAAASASRSPVAESSASGARPGPGSSRSDGRRAAAGGPRPRPGRGERAPAGRPEPRPAPRATCAARETCTVAGAALATVSRQARRSRAAAVKGVGVRQRVTLYGSRVVVEPAQEPAGPLGVGGPGAGGHPAGGQPGGELLGRCGRCGCRRRRVGGRRVCRGQAHPRSASSSAPAEASPLTASWALRSAWVGCAGSRCARVS